VSACSAGVSSRAGRPGGESARPALTRLGGGQPGPRYYLALGDSLAAGVQPASDGPAARNRSGYAGRLAGLLRRHLHLLRVVRLGCAGETTGTMIDGGICRYRAGSQLAAAVSLLRAHRRHVALVTMDIGANDPNSCVLQGSLAALPRCLAARATATLRNLSTILSALRLAAGPRVLIVGMTYYVPELAEWLAGRAGAVVAVISERLVTGYNRLLTREYRRHGARVADVFGAFRSADFGDRVRLRGHGLLPGNVAAICRLTWMCSPPTRGPDEHANDAGYAVIARAFWRVIAR
jgi:lysophospholipase L1-like esterase